MNKTSNPFYCVAIDVRLSTRFIGAMINVFERLKTGQVINDKESDER